MSSNVTKRLSAMYLVLFLLIFSVIPVYTQKLESSYENIKTIVNKISFMGEVSGESANVIGGVALEISKMTSNDNNVTVKKSDRQAVKAIYLDQSNLLDISETDIAEISMKKTEEVSVEYEEYESSNIEIETSQVNTGSGRRLTKIMGLNRNGPSGEETWYNDGTQESVVAGMRRIGFSEEKYPYWIRDDGVRMLGRYVMVAADFNIRPLGTILESSLGTAIVCDTGGFARNHPTRLDIFVTW